MLRHPSPLCGTYRTVFKKYQNVFAGAIIQLDQFLVRPPETKHGLTGACGATPHGPIGVSLASHAAVQADHHEGEGEGIRIVLFEW
jgi:hypothetical protein